MALGFTSHYTNNNEQPFGSLILSAVESETAGSVASSNNSAPAVAASLFSEGGYDSCEFSVSANIDYSQYANCVASSGSTETAGSVAYSGGDFSGASAGGVSSFSCGGGFSSSCSVSSASFTC